MSDVTKRLEAANLRALGFQAGESTVRNPNAADVLRGLGFRDDDLSAVVAALSKASSNLTKLERENDPEFARLYSLALIFAVGVQYGRMDAEAQDVPTQEAHPPR